MNALLFQDLIPYYIKYGYKSAESNPELETNAMCKASGNILVIASTAAAVPSLRTSNTSESEIKFSNNK